MAVTWARKIEGWFDKRKKQPKKRISWERPNNTYRRDPNEFQVGNTYRNQNLKGKEEKTTKNFQDPKGLDMVTKKAQNQYTRPNLGNCFRCGQQGHLSNECHLRKAIAIIDENNQDDEEDKEQWEEDVAYIEPDDGEQLSCIVQRVLLNPKLDTHPQKHCLFRTRCTINGKVCNVIIDNGSSENIVSQKLVNALNLKVDPHPNPYKVSWIKKGGEATINSICTVPLSIGNYYKDQIICDVLEMDVCHILLGRPWQYDLQATHKGRENTYEFLWMGRKVVLMP